MIKNSQVRIATNRPLTDEKLYELCKQYGERALLWRRKFAGLLPEVNRRKLYEKKGFSSISEFAAKLAGMSKEQVDVVLNLEKRFKDKPILKEILVEGKVSVNKLARIVSVATIENQWFLADQVQLLPQKAVETLVRDMKTQNGLIEPEIEDKSLRAQTFDNLKLSGKVIKKLSELQDKGIDINELMLEFLKEREEKIEQKKTEIVEEQERKSIVSKDAKAPSHYVSVKIQKILHEEHGTKCSISGCDKPAKEIHHTVRFGISQNHDPHFLAPLCREHHLIAHSIDLKFNQKLHEKRRK